MNFDFDFENDAITIVIGIIAIVIVIGLSYLLTAGIIKLITMCFGLTFSWSIATGIWLIMILLKNIFK